MLTTASISGASRFAKKKGLANPFDDFSPFGETPPINSAQIIPTKPIVKTAAVDLPVQPVLVTEKATLVQQENKAPAELKEPAATPLGKTSKKRTRGGALSINNSLNNTANAEDGDTPEIDLTAINPDLPKDEFTLAILLNFWNDYLQKAAQEQRQLITNSLKGKKLELKENFTITLHLDNEIQQDYFTNEKPQLLQFLRKKLNNYSLQFEVEIAKHINTLAPYSQKEKLDYLIKKNPKMIDLLQKLKLDIR